MTQFAKCVASFRPSPIRQMMSAALNPDVISFAGGMPGNELFPVDDVKEMVAQMSRHNFDLAMQYGPTVGFPGLIDLLKTMMVEQGFDMTRNKIMVTTGSTQVMNIITKIMVDPGDVVLTEDPVFVGSVGGFVSYDAKIVGIPMDKDGIIISELEKALKLHPKFIYVTPTFHNPAGLTYSPGRRQEFIKVMAQYPETLVLEDNAYVSLYYDDKVATEIIPMKVMAENENQYIYCSSFSKIFGPGLRLGWMVIPNDMFEPAEICKQSMDACSPMISQMLAYEFLKSGRLDRYVKKLRPTYKQRRDRMIECIDKYLPADIEYVKPMGGFFIWMKVPKGIDETKLFKICADKGVIFVIGNAFDPQGKINGHIRLSYSNTSPEVIEKGMKILGEAMHEMLA